MCSSERKEQYSKYVLAVKNHNIEEILSYYDNNVEITLNNDVVVKGIDQMRNVLSATLSDPNYSYELEEYLPVDSDDRIHVLLKRHDNQHLDVYYVFSKENPDKYIQVIGTFINNS